MRQLCLPPKLADKFKKAIRDGQINVDDLATKSSADRKAVFQKYITDPELLTKFNKGFEERAVVSAENIAVKKDAIIERLTKAGKEDKIPQALADYEIKLVKRQNELLKNYLDRSLAGIPVNRKKNIVARVKSVEHLLVPGEQKVFLNDLVAQKLGYGVDQDTAKELFELSNKVQLDATKADSIITRIKEVTRGNIEKKLASSKLDIKTTNKDKVADFLTNLVDETSAKGLNLDKELVKRSIRSTLDKIGNEAEFAEQFNRYIDGTVDNYSRKLWEGRVNITDDIAELFDVPIEDVELLAKGAKNLKIKDPLTKQAAMQRWQLGLNQHRLVEKVSGLKTGMIDESIDALVESGQITKQEGVARKSKEFALAVAEGSKSASGSLDFSLIGRQGWAALFTHPVMSVKALGSAIAEGARIAKNMKRVPDVKEMGGMLKSIRKAFGSIDPDSTLTLIDIDIATRYNAITGKYARASNGYGIGVGEEFFPSTWPERVPGLGRLYKLTEIAYSSTARKMRADLTDTFIERLEVGGHNVMDKKIADELGLLVGAMTGRGKVLGADFLEQSPKAARVLNLVLWSPRLIGSTFHFLYSPFKFAFNTVAKGKIDPVLAISAQNTVQTLATAAVTVMAIKETANVFGVKTKFDYNPASSQFGTLTIGSASFDVSGGRGAAVALLGRFFDAMDGMIYDPKLEIERRAAWGQDSLDVLTNFYTNRTSPAFSILKTAILGKNFEGEEMWRSFDDIPSSAAANIMSLIVPLGIINFGEKSGIFNNIQDKGFMSAFDTEGTDYSQGLMVFMLEGIGLSTRDINIRPGGKEWILLRKHSQVKFREAVKDFNEVVFEEVNALREDSAFQEMEAEEQFKEIDKVANRIKSRTIDKYIAEIPPADLEKLEAKK